MAQNLMVWLMERRVVLEERAEQLRKQPTETEAEVARLEAAEVVYQQYQQDTEAGHPDADAWQQALEETTGGRPVPTARPADTPGAAGQLLIPHRTQNSSLEDLPADYQAIMGIIAGREGPLQAKDAARALGLETVPAMVEPVRGKLRKLAERGWIIRTPPDATCPADPRAARKNGRFRP